LDTVSDLVVLVWLLVGMSWRRAFGSRLLRKIKEKWSLIKFSPRWHLIHKVAVSGHKGQIVVTSFKDIFCIIFLLK
jgi:hypothetical protein